MNAIDAIKEKIPEFPGYGDDTSRERSDELVRSYLGEHLAEMQVRLSGLPAELASRVEDLILRAAFANQTVYCRYEEGARTRKSFDGVAEADVAVLDASDKLASVDVEQLPGLLDAIVAALDGRDAVMLGG